MSAGINAIAYRLSLLLDGCREVSSTLRLYSNSNDEIVLGQSLYEITTRLKAEKRVYTKLDLTFAHDSTATKPIILSLPAQGIRLRFDGPCQLLRLIEVTDFTKNKLSYKEQGILSKPSADSPPRKACEGPTFKHIYSKVFGPTFPGEYLPISDIHSAYGTYTLSYPGIAFNFPVASGAWNPSKDFASILSSPSTLPATSLALFSGPNWPDVRPTLFTSELEDPKLNSTSNKEKLSYPDEIFIIYILGGGSLRLEKAHAQGHVCMQLGSTTPQDLVAELGPPDAVYRKSDQHLSIHRARTHSGNSESTTGSRRSEDQGYGSHDDGSRLRGGDGNATPGGTSEEQTEEESEVSDDEESGDDENLDDAEDCFYNYFHHGFDVLISRPVAPSEPPPSAMLHPDQYYPSAGRESTPSSSPRSGGDFATGEENGLDNKITSTPAPLVATKIILHGNIPGTYAFGRHRRIRWVIPFLTDDDTAPVTSETPYSNIAEALNDEFRDMEVSDEERRQRERGMALNRGWGESVGSSMEVLGNWDEGSRMGGPVTGKRGGHEKAKVDMQGSLAGKNGMGSSVLYGWPGLVFEVGRGGVVSGLTVF